MSATKFEITAPAEVTPEWLELVRQQVKSLHYGVVQIVVHDSQIVQVERTEKFRLDPAREKSDSSDTPTGYLEAIHQNRQPTRTLEER